VFLSSESPRMSLQPRFSPPPDGSPVHAEPRFTQLAALCWRKAAEGKREVLLVTSSTGRWILPKGWPIHGKNEAEAALAEAWEEGGVARGKVARRAIGSYMAIKRTPAGDDVPCLHKVFAIKVREQTDAFPEAHRRDRRWVAPAEAAAMVDEDGLRDILRKF
jgi:8-oxo-dGTP pyrophosphatase MutT (NUDIX family)